MTTPSPNFAYLAYHDARLVALGTQAEEHFAGDPTVTLFKLRQFAEVLAQRAAAKVGLFLNGEEGLQQLIDRLWERSVIGATQRTLFHDLRRVGNAAVHEGRGDHSEALHQLRMARELGVWFQRSFGNNKKFEPGPFVPPSEPKKADATLHHDLQRLRDEVTAHKADLQAAQRAVEDAKKAAEAELAERLTAEQRAAKAAEDAGIWETLAKDEIEAHREAAKAEAQRSAALEEQNKKLLAELAAAQAAAQALPPQQLALTIEQVASPRGALLPARLGWVGPRYPWGTLEQGPRRAGSGYRLRASHVWRVGTPPVATTVTIGMAAFRGLASATRVSTTAARYTRHCRP